MLWYKNTILYLQDSPEQLFHRFGHSGGKSALLSEGDFLPGLLPLVEVGDGWQLWPCRKIKDCLMNYPSVLDLLLAGTFSSWNKTESGRRVAGMLRVICVEMQMLLMAEEFTGSWSNWVKPGRYLLDSSAVENLSPVEPAGEKGDAGVLEVSWTLERWGIFFDVIPLH